MQEYVVQVTETLVKTVMVIAPSREAAITRVSDKWSDSQIVLDASNFEAVSFAIIAE